MSWTVACFCGTVFEAPPDRCPSCASPVDSTDQEPQRPGGTLPPMGFGSLEQELSELTSSAHSG
jgi:hypothetical protein